ncbi:metal ABC transporter substrate-binding protein [Atopococcus tabaci]|uniref:metal ABC transporter substrate-binding protein n=1 Tax=Atopococcus tabaci TaxID=269774 RepID=UPI0024091713|nr:metal ABC transporter substrate-binding protein [Atopococcus tabaci]
MKKILRTGLTVAFALGLFGCGNAGQDTSDGNADTDSLSVVTTFYPMYEFTQQVAGEAADVSMLIPSGTDSHGFEPSAKDVAQISEADVFVYSSPEMETWVTDILNVIESEDVVVVEASEAIELLENETEHDHEHAHGEEGHTHAVDPHVWLDPIYAQQQVEAIRDGLIEADPDNQTLYTEQAAHFNSELDTLHQDFTQAFEGAENRVFVTQHAAFGYLANRYGLIQEPIGGYSTETEPDPARLAGISSFIQENNLPVVYYNQSESSAIAETVAEETGIETAQLHSIEGVSDVEQADGATYLTLMRRNLEALKLSIR